MYRLALAAFLGGTTALAAQETSFDGVWRSSPDGECVAGEDDPAAIRIAENVLHGVESECRMTRPVDIRGMNAVLYDMECSGTDDSSFTERAMFLEAADGGLYLVWNGYAFKYDTCDPDDAVETAETADLPEDTDADEADE